MVEAALAHVVQNKVEVAYARSDRPPAPELAKFAQQTGGYWPEDAPKGKREGALTCPTHLGNCTPMFIR